MFNVWLPAVLESRAEGEGDEAIRAALKDFVLYSGELRCRAPTPRANADGQSLGARDHWCVQLSATCRIITNTQLGAWMIQTTLGRRKSLAICTLATGVSTFIFIRVKSDAAVVVSSMFISMAATAMYAVLCE
jgi:hypothetical protein